MAIKCEKIPYCRNFHEDKTARTSDFLCGSESRILRCNQFHCDIAPAYNEVRFCVQQQVIDPKYQHRCTKALIGCENAIPEECDGYVKQCEFFVPDIPKIEVKSKKYDNDKLCFDLIPPEFLKAVATILTFGADKYGPNNWQNLPDFEARFTAALMRHLNAWRSGDKLDQESGKPHLWHIACNVAFLIWKEQKEYNKDVNDKIQQEMRNTYRL